MGVLGEDWEKFGIEWCSGEVGDGSPELLDFLELALFAGGLKGNVRTVRWRVVGVFRGTAQVSRGCRGGKGDAVLRK